MTEEQINKLQAEFENEKCAIKRWEMVEKNPKELATQENFEREECWRVMEEMVRENPEELATKENFEKEVHWLVKCVIVLENPKLTTQENFKWDGNEEVRDIIEKLKKDLTNKNI